MFMVSRLVKLTGVTSTGGKGRTREKIEQQKYNFCVRAWEKCVLWLVLRRDVTLF